MATTYKSNLYNTTDAGAVFQSSDGNTSTLRQQFSYNIANGSAFIVNDLVLLAPIPMGYSVVGWWLEIPDLDSSTGIRIQLGDRTTADAYMAAGGTASDLSTVVGIAAGKLSHTWASVVGSIPTSYTARHASRAAKIAADDFILKVSTAATGTAATTGTIRGYIEYQQN